MNYRVPQWFTVVLLFGLFLDFSVSTSAQAREDYGSLVARIPYVASRAGWRTRIQVLSVDPSEEHSFTFIGKGETGDVVEVVEDKSIKAMGSYNAFMYLRSFISLFSEEVKEDVYSIDIYSKTARSEQILTYVDYSDVARTLQSSMRIDGLDLFHRLPIEWIVTGISGWYTGVNLQNYSDQEIDVYFRKQDGTHVKLEGSQFDISQPNASRAFLFSELLPSNPVSSGEFLAFTKGSQLNIDGNQISGEPINALSGLTVFANSSEHGMSEGIPAVGGFSDGTHRFNHRFYIPIGSVQEIADDEVQMIVNEKYPYYGFALQNVNDFPVSLRMTHFNPGGINLGGTVRNLGARENVGYTWNGLRQELGVTDGTVIFKPEIGGHVRLEVEDQEENPAFATAMTADGEGQFAIVTGEKALSDFDRGSNLVCFYVENQKVSSLIQLINTGSETADIQFTLRGSSGSVYTTFQANIPGNGTYSLNIHELPDWPYNSGRNGILLVESNGSPIVGIQHQYSRGMQIGETKVSGKRLASIPEED